MPNTNDMIGIISAIARSVPGTAGARAEAAAERAEAVLESIPEDYTEMAADVEQLQDDVGDLKSAMNAADADLLNLAENQKSEEQPPKKAFSLFTMPDGFTGTFCPVSIFTNGTEFTTDFDKENFKQTGGRVYYVDTIAHGATSANDGSTPQKPVNLYAALNRAADGDTVMLAEGIYTSNDTNALTSALFDKSINVIGVGNVVFCIDGAVYKALDSKAYDSESGLWTCTRASVATVISSEDIRLKYKQASSLDLCKTTPCSWFLSGSTLYINDKHEPDVIISTVRDGLIIEPSAARKLYFENIKFIGGRWSVMLINPSSGTLETCFNNCIFTMTYGTYSNVRAISGHHLFVDCEASFSPRDGFAYSPATTDDLQFVEIGCFGINNGLQMTDTQSTSNGSTAHQGATGIRINGQYYNNWGGNVADVHDGTMSVNLGCVARDSVGTDSYNEGFSAQQPGATMWLYNCIALGNRRDINATTVNGATSTINAINCTFDTMTIGAGVINITGGIIIPANADLNDYTKERMYKCLRSSVAATLENTPVTDSMFVMQVVNMDTIYTMQIIYTTAKIYIRRAFDSLNGSWTAWKSVALS